MRYQYQRLYANTVHNVEMTKPKVSLLSLDHDRKKQGKDEECRIIHKAWCDRAPAQYHEDELSFISAPRSAAKTVQKYLPVALRTKAFLLSHQTLAVGHPGVLKQ